MAEARTRLLVASMLVLLLASLVPVQADGETPVRLETELMNVPLTPWYGPGDVVEPRRLLALGESVATDLECFERAFTAELIADYVIEGTPLQKTQFLLRSLLG